MPDEVFDFEQVFGDDYLHFYAPSLEEASDADVELVWRLLQLQPATEVLDLACGHGRIANRLAHRGANVTGLDASRLFLERATEDATEAGVAVRYLQGDMRSLPFADATFDCVLATTSIPQRGAQPPSGRPSATGRSGATRSPSACSWPSNFETGSMRPGSGR